MGSELYLRELGDGRFSILLCDDRTETQMPAMTPAEALIAFSELDYTDYRKVVRWLRDEHPLFEERIDIPVSDFEDFVAEAILLTPDLHEIDPVSGFVVTDILHWTLQAKDDGTAMFLLAAGQAILRVMEEPLRVQNYLRNIMEVTFEGTAGRSPAKRPRRKAQDIDTITLLGSYRFPSEASRRRSLPLPEQCHNPPHQ